MTTLDESIAILEAALKGALPGEIGISDESEEPNEYKKFMNIFMPNIEAYDKQISDYMVNKWNDHIQMIIKNYKNTDTIKANFGNKKLIREKMTIKTIRFTGTVRGMWLLDIQYDLKPAPDEHMPNLEAHMNSNGSLKLIHCTFDG